MSAVITPELAQIAERIRVRIRRTITDIIETGRDLAEAKAELGHGHFGDWVWNEFNMTARTAQNYMGAAEWAEGKNEIVSHLSPTMVYALAAPSTPASVTDRVIADAKAGLPVSDECVKRHIKAAIEEERERKRHEREAPVRAVMAAVLAAESEPKQPEPDTEEPEIIPPTPAATTRKPTKPGVDLGRTDEEAQGRIATQDELVKFYLPSGETIHIEAEDARAIYIEWLLEQPKGARIEDIRALIDATKLSIRDFAILISKFEYKGKSK